MVQGYHLDPDGRVAEERFAVVYAPKRLRDRVPEGNVQVVETEAAARAAADPVKNLFPARVIGPARSSEGVSVYYIVCWLDGDAI
jgi:hypothetical protein